MPLKAWLVLLVLGFGFPIQAMPRDVPMRDAGQEARATALFHQLRCVVCEGQTIADSNADLAGDMRGLVRAMVQEGKSDREILRYLTERYGEHILMAPPFDAMTGLLWIAPLLLLALGTVIAIPYFRKGERP